MANPARYRFIKFYGGRILQSREVSEIQRIQEGLDLSGVNRVTFDLDILYREGASFNISPVRTGTSVSLNPTDATLPMYLFVRGRWEILQPSEVSNPLTMPTNGGSVYLNWVVRQVTSAEDPTLVDTNTGEPTADMGELNLSVSNSDTSGASLTATQFEKNVQAIALFNYDAANLLVGLDNVNPVAWGNLSKSGLVSLTTNSSSGVAASGDDIRLSDPRTPKPLSVTDASVRVPLAVDPAANNADGTPMYNLGSDPGGISSAKIIHSTGSQLVSDAIEWVKSQLSNITSLLSSHIGVRLGLNTTHPMPTAVDVGATPLSHVGMQLGLPGSHPASVTTSSGGFAVNRDSSIPPSTNDPAFGLFSSGVLQSALFHNGDIFSNLSNGVIASPVGTSTTGSLSLVSTIAKVLAEHVNQTSHANPHGLAPGDIGAATTGYVDSAVTNVLAQSENYTNSVIPAVTVSSVTVQLSTNAYTGQGNQLLPGTVPNQGTYLIIRYSPNGASGVGAVEVAFGAGTANNGDTVPLPNTNFSRSNLIPSIAPSLVGYAPRTINQIVCYLTAGGVINMRVNDNNGIIDGGMVNWTAIAWRVNA